MKLSHFRYDLPLNLIAQRPTPRREDSKLLVVNKKTGEMQNKHFKDILEFFDDKDVFVVNNTKVFPARMYGRKEKTGARIEVFLLRELNKANRLWDVIVDPARKIRVGNKLYFGDDTLVAEVVDNTTSRGRTIRFLFDGTDEELWKLIEKLGEMPIPKYMNRAVEKLDKDRFQTIFAKHIGAVSPPSAGLHFTKELMMRMEIKGVNFTEVTVHNGLGAFRAVEVEDLTKHKMDSEFFDIPTDTSKIVNKALDEKQKICAVGSSVMRAIESSVSSTGRLNVNSGWTDKFLFPPHDFKIANCMITNFHPPESTLLMLSAAFAGYDELMEAYQEAIKKKYKFMAYGDALLII